MNAAVIAGFVGVAILATLTRAVITAPRPSSPSRAPRRDSSTRFPGATLALNTLGAFGLGLITAAAWWSDPVVMTGAGLGSLTTFSTVAGETAVLLDAGRRGRAASYLAATLVIGVAAALAGLNLGQAFR